MWMEQEGVGYLVQHYLNPDHIADPNLKLRFIQAAKDLDFIEKRLEPHLNEDQDYEDDTHCVLDKS